MFRLIFKDLFTKIQHNLLGYSLSLYCYYKPAYDYNMGGEMNCDLDMVHNKEMY